MPDEDSATPRKTKAWTERGLEAIKVKVRTDLTDSENKGLVLRITPIGTKTWSFIYRRKVDGVKARAAIGRFGRGVGEFGLSAARTEAQKLIGIVASGKDPSGEAAAIRKADTVSELLEAFIADHPKQGARWTIECARIFEKEVNPLIGNVKLPELERHHIRSVLNAVKARNAPVAVNRTLSALRRALAWGVEQDSLATNPASGIKTNVIETPKDRALTDSEIKALWAGLDDAPMSERSKLALKIILATGQRPGEVCGMLKSELNLKGKVWLLPKTRTKNGKPHTIPLSSLALELIEQAMEIDPTEPFVFMTRGRGKDGLIRPKAMDSHALSHAMRKSLEKLGFANNTFSPHDLRRTAATGMARLGLSDHIVGKVLNHVSGKAKTITAQVYITHEFIAEKRNALDAWANELEVIVGLRLAPGNVLSLRA